MSSIVYSCFGAPVWGEQKEKALDKTSAGGAVEQFVA